MEYLILFSHYFVGLYKKICYLRKNILFMNTFTEPYCHTLYFSYHNEER